MDGKDIFNRMDGVTCKYCRWYVSMGKIYWPIDGDELIEKGQCRKHAPKDHDRWPLVLPTDFCGDFKRRSNLP